MQEENCAIVVHFLNPVGYIMFVQKIKVWDRQKEAWQAP